MDTISITKKTMKLVSVISKLFYVIYTVVSNISQFSNQIYNKRYCVYMLILMLIDYFINLTIVDILVLISKQFTN